jgi:hypothetical protein
LLLLLMRWWTTQESVHFFILTGSYFVYDPPT